MFGYKASLLGSKFLQEFQPLDPDTDWSGVLDWDPPETECPPGAARQVAGTSAPLSSLKECFVDLQSGGCNGCSHTSNSVLLLFSLQP